MGFDTLDRTTVAGLPIIVADRPTAIAQIVAVAKSGGAGDVHLANSYVVSLAHRRSGYHDLLRTGAAIYPDGKPLTWVSRVLPGANLHQVRGPSLFPDLMDVGRSSGVRHYLFGNTDVVLDELTAELERRYPGVEIVGRQRSHFRPLTAAEQTTLDADIRRTEPDIVWVGLGTPLQNLEARRISDELGKVAICVGAAFDFVAGTIPAAPEWMTRLGVEWCFRLALEPRRLWKRYLVGNAVFLRASLLPRRTSRVGSR
ncbi:WecB/TagA/CpsF family glycosyltransferase [Curtobacterium sp. Leaf261]|uniref:WecB/TagA/CpsF family glycosyltransferase n=1 Tax=Curtobacterium sp. Leaf261 TaxID=1736311 RepID=UPI0006F27059|nr:WecB/TagA/CpsF family glycosyltransferase [Curtobacterium sp. Leaf261]KQO61374.1 hypothetical protein ASF23_12920 [Curtobacterium sp. Leaf261]